MATLRVGCMGHAWGVPEAWALLLDMPSCPLTWQCHPTAAPPLLPRWTGHLLALLQQQQQQQHRPLMRTVQRLALAWRGASCLEDSYCLRGQSTHGSQGTTANKAFAIARLLKKMSPVCPSNTLDQDDGSHPSIDP